MPFELPKLPYPTNALAPTISQETMELHHGKHHAAYVKNLNAALAAAPGHANAGIEALLTNLDALPESIRTAVRNNGGGHFNHTLFWTTLTPNGSAPEGAFLKAVEQFKPSEQTGYMPIALTTAVMSEPTSILPMVSIETLTMIGTSSCDLPRSFNASRHALIAHLTWSRS